MKELDEIDWGSDDKTWATCANSTSMPEITLESIMATMKEFEKEFPKPVEPRGLFDIDMPITWKSPSIFDIPIYTSPYIAPVDEWVPPPNPPFVEYEPKDYEWLKKLGFGTWKKRWPVYGFTGFDNRRAFIMASS